MDTMQGNKTYQQEQAWQHPANIAEEVWVWMLTHVGEFGLFLFFYASMAGLYALGAFGFAIIDKYKFFSSYKIQAGKYPSEADYKRCIKNLVWNYLFFILPAGVISFPFTGYLGLSYSLPLPSLYTFSWQILFCLVGEDALHYFLHRFFHTPWFYQNIHKEHHYYAAPFGLSATYAHPVEVIFLGIPTFAPVLAIRPHFFTFYSWFIIRQLDAVLTHSGYEFPWIPFQILPYYGGTEFHDYHHKAFKCNYGSRFTLLDRLLGTYKPAPSRTSHHISSKTTPLSPSPLPSSKKSI
eukprot:TRINITY_DN2141_c0_g1_i1.p1 TRINITY_DN2141_c0_g1~~TRINITY_DN2141_c0_g1_i1.p1  ORF type:complete len:294 (-),score=50.73 TRINITY_DN2141_c0_g1_i1:77-958(-)